jgi:hypothetical protein
MDDLEDREDGKNQPVWEDGFGFGMPGRWEQPIWRG